jgi:fucose 4-O-acetylase-like acetyltransferase
MCKSNDRIAWIDIAKGIGILLVIIGHMPSFPEWIRAWIFSFHMPLFFSFQGMQKSSQKHYHIYQ